MMNNTTKSALFRKRILFGSPNWVNENKTIKYRFIEAKSTKQRVTEQIYDLRMLRLCGLTGEREQND